MTLEGWTLAWKEEIVQLPETRMDDISVTQPLTLSPLNGLLAAADERRSRERERL